MRPKTFIKAAGIVTAFGAIVLAAMFSSSRRVRAIDDDDESSESKIRQGFEIAPVPLNLDGKNRARPGGIRQLHCQRTCRLQWLSFRWPRYRIRAGWKPLSS